MPHSPTTQAPEDLAHRGATPAHWLATACAMAAVIAGAGFLEPHRTAGAAEVATAAGPVSRPEIAAPDAHAVTYPLDCKGAPQLVTDTAEGDLDGDGRPETVAAVRCDAGSGTPPHTLYVLTRDRAEDSVPRVVATLLDAGRRQTVTDLAVGDGDITATLLGYSSPSVPRYSPDVKRLAKWRWTAGKFRQELTDPTAGRV